MYSAACCLLFEDNGNSNLSFVPRRHSEKNSIFTCLFVLSHTHTQRTHRWHSIHSSPRYSDTALFSVLSQRRFHDVASQNHRRQQGQQGHSSTLVVIKQSTIQSLWNTWWHSGLDEHTTVSPDWYTSKQTAHVMGTSFVSPLFCIISKVPSVSPDSRSSSSAVSIFKLFSVTFCNTKKC
jgi:hypothetical protein